MTVFDYSTKITPEIATEQLENILSVDEIISCAYNTDRCIIAFTDQRLIIVERLVVNNKFKSIPYSSITMFSAEIADNFDLDPTLKIWVYGNLTIERQFKRNCDVYEMQQVLSNYVYNAHKR